MRPIQQCAVWYCLLWWSVYSVDATATPLTPLAPLAPVGAMCTDSTCAIPANSISCPSLSGPWSGQFNEITPQIGACSCKSNGQAIITVDGRVVKIVYTPSKWECIHCWRPAGPKPLTWTGICSGVDELEIGDTVLILRGHFGSKTIEAKGTGLFSYAGHLMLSR